MTGRTRPNSLTARRQARETSDAFCQVGDVKHNPLYAAEWYLEVCGVQVGRYIVKNGSIEQGQVKVGHCLAPGKSRQGILRC